MTSFHSHSATAVLIMSGLLLSGSLKFCKMCGNKKFLRWQQWVPAHHQQNNNNILHTIIAAELTSYSGTRSISSADHD